MPVTILKTQTATCPVIFPVNSLKAAPAVLLLTETAALYPAQTFRAETDGLTVFVEADAGAFPERTTMTARLVPNEQVLDAVMNSN